MPLHNIYASDEDEPFFEQLVEEGMLSQVVAKAVRHFVSARDVDFTSTRVEIQLQQAIERLEARLRKYECLGCGHAPHSQLFSESKCAQCPCVNTSPGTYGRSANNPTLLDPQAAVRKLAWALYNDRYEAFESRIEAFESRIEALEKARIEDNVSKPYGMELIHRTLADQINTLTHKVDTISRAFKHTRRPE